jgi:hypothetical protein
MVAHVWIRLAERDGNSYREQETPCWAWVLAWIQSAFNATWEWENSIEDYSRKSSGAQ